MEGRIVNGKMTTKQLGPQSSLHPTYLKQLQNQPESRRHRKPRIHLPIRRKQRKHQQRRRGEQVRESQVNSRGMMQNPFCSVDERGSTTRMHEEPCAAGKEVRIETALHANTVASPDRPRSITNNESPIANNVEPQSRSRSKVTRQFPRPTGLDPTVGIVPALHRTQSPKIKHAVHDITMKFKWTATYKDFTPAQISFRLGSEADVSIMEASYPAEYSDCSDTESANSEVYTEAVKRVDEKGR